MFQLVGILTPKLKFQVKFKLNFHSNKKYLWSVFLILLWKELLFQVKLNPERMFKLLRLKMLLIHWNSDSFPLHTYTLQPAHLSSVHLLWSSRFLYLPVKSSAQSQWPWASVSKACHLWGHICIHNFCQSGTTQSVPRASVKSSSISTQ